MVNGVIKVNFINPPQNNNPIPTPSHSPQNNNPKILRKADWYLQPIIASHHPSHHCTNSSRKWKKQNQYSTGLKTTPNNLSYLDALLQAQFLVLFANTLLK